MDADAFAQAIQQGLSNINISMPDAQAAVSAQDFTELRESMTKMTQAVESMAKSGGSARGGEVHIPDRLVEVTESLAAAVSGAGVSAPGSYSSTGTGRCPKCGQFAGEEHTCPERQPRLGRPVTDAKNMAAQEHILSAVTLAAPDPYLMSVPTSVGGQTFQALEEFIPNVDPNFEINEQTEKILRTMSATLQLGVGQGKERLDTRLWLIWTGRHRQEHDSQAVGCQHQDRGRGREHHPGHELHGSQHHPRIFDAGIDRYDRAGNRPTDWLDRLAHQAGQDRPGRGHGQCHQRE